MDNAQKAIMIGVGLFITIIIISAVLLIVNLGTGLVDDATANLSSISSSLQSQILQNYDNKLLSGTQVRSAIQQYMSSADVSVVLYDSTGTAVAGIGNKNLSKSAIELSNNTALIAPGTYTTVTEGGETMSMSEFTNIDATGGTYINTAKRYDSYILYTGTTTTGADAMVGIVFVPADGNITTLIPAS